jgi:hypothetical protein
VISETAHRCLATPMDDIQQLYAQLAQADQSLTAGERLFGNLVAHIDEMTARGKDTAALDRMLRLYRDTLEQWQAHQQVILDTIVRLTGSCAGRIASMGGREDHPRARFGFRSASSLPHRHVRLAEAAR